MDFGTLMQSLTDWVVQIGTSVNELPGTLAFALGLFTWFAVEQILRRVMSGMRWVIIVGAIVALGFTVPYLASFLFDFGGAEARP